MPKLKESEPRSAKLTVLVTQRTQDDLKALRAATFESTGDLVNRLLARELFEQAELVEEGREIMQQQEARRKRVMARSEPMPEKEGAPEATADPDPKPDTEGAPEATADPDPIHRYGKPSVLTIPSEDLDLWAGEGRNQRDEHRFKTEAASYIEWLGIGQMEISEAYMQRYELYLKQKYPSNKTVRNHMAIIRNLWKWANRPIERF